MGTPCYTGECVEDVIAGTFSCLCENGTFGDYCQLGEYAHMTLYGRI